MSDVRISAPARPEFLHVLRTVVAAVGSRLDYPYDALDDLRLAVDEACAMLFRVAEPATTVHMTMAPTDDGMQVVVSTDARPSDGSWPPSDRSLAWQVLSALADRAEMDLLPDGSPALRLSKRVEGE